MLRKKFCRLMVVLTIMILTVAVVSCNKNQSEGTDVTGTGTSATTDGDEVVAGDEKGEYYCDSSSSEYLLTLKDNGIAELKTDTQRTGEYELNGTELTLRFSKTADEEELIIDAKYENGNITLTYNGAELNFLKKVYYTVTFETNGGSDVGSVEVLNGKTVGEPAKPTRTNYQFIAWCKDSGLTEVFDFENEKITQNITIYAKWDYIALTNTITYDDEVGKTENPTAQVVEGENYALEVPTISAEGYIFVGWFTDGGEQLTDSQGKSLSVWDPAKYGNITVYAHTEMDLTYEESSDGTSYSVSGSEQTSHLENILIPAYHNGKPVTEVLDFDGYGSLKTVSIPNTVTYISESAFSESPLLSSFEVYTADGVTEPAFTSQNGVIFGDNGHTLVRYPVAKEGTKYEVPASVTVIAPSAFYEVVGGDEYSPTYAGILEEVVLPANITQIGDYAFYERGNLKKVSFAGNGSADLSIGNYAFARTSLQSFVFTDNLVSIGDFAFSNIGDYGSAFPGDLVLPSKVQTIGASAFQYAWGLTSVTIPASVTSIGENAFRQCYSLMSITFEDGCSITSIPDGMLASTGISTITIPSSVTYIGSSAFESCGSISELVIPEGVQTIGDEAFASMYALKKINIPASVVSFGSSVFSGCSSLSLENVVVEEGNTAITIYDGVMYTADMKTLLYYSSNDTRTEYIMPNQVESIPASLFNYNRYLTTVTLSSSLKSIPESAFDGSVITTITIPASVTEIAADAFAYSSLQTIVFEDGSKLESIGESAFQGAKLTSLELPDSVKTIGANAFANNSLVSVKLGEGITVLEDGCFSGNKTLETVVLPSALEIISNSVFKNCISLKEITLPESLKQIGTDVFSGVTGLQNINISENNSVYKSIDGNLYTKDGKTLIQYALGKEDTKFVVPDSVTKISDSAFNGAAKLTEIELGANVSEIGSYAFYGCSGLLSIDLSNVKTLGESAFSYCTSLAQVTMGESLTVISSSAFSGCEALKSFDFSNITEIQDGAFMYSGLEEINLTDKLTVLDESSFQYCTSLTSVRIPGSVKTVGCLSFSGCSNLVSVIIEEGVVTLDSWAFSSCGNLESVTLPSTLETIMDYVFDRAGKLESVTLPAGLKNLHYTSFDKNISLKEINVDENNPYFSSIDGNLYSKDGTVLIKYSYPKDEESFVVPDTVTTISEYAFFSYWNDYAPEWDKVYNYEQKLTSIVFGENLTTIEDYAFLNCKNLRTVTINSQGIADTIFSGNNYLSGYVTTLIIKEGLQVSTDITDNFSPAPEQTEDGYVIYTKNK